MSDIEQSYYRVMDLLRRTRMEHGLCEPRSRRACTHCNAVDDLKVLVDEYKGAPIREIIGICRHCGNDTPDGSTDCGRCYP